MRVLLLAHRTLGIAVGALMVSWCLSGVVMVFVPFPRLSEEKRLQGLSPIAWEGCCRFESGPQGGDLGAGFTIEMLAQRPVLRARARDGSPVLFDLLTGAAIAHVSPREAAEVAQAFASRSREAARPADPGAAPRLLALVESDQWTVGGVSGAERPVYRFALGDRAGTEVYVSSRSGRAVQATTAGQRFWSWLGSIPHWLYFARLRAHVALWTAVVVYASLAGCFLTAIGIVIGIQQLRPARPGRRWSPYRGFAWWHHVAGLFFGIFTLTWVASGLLSMNPWGLLDSDDAQPERARLAGAPPPTSRVQAGIHAVKAQQRLASAVSVAFAPSGGRPYFVVAAADGQRRRLDETGRPAPLDALDLSRIAAELDPRAGPAAPEELREDDAYFFSGRHEPTRLPVLRVVAGGADGARYYLDPVSGNIETKVDRNGRRYRWLHGGLHRLDFASSLRRGPLGYVLLLSLMAGVLVVCVTGAYLGCRRLLRWGRG